MALKTKLITPKLQETRDFYVRHFGMEVVEEWNDPGDAGSILALTGGRGEAYLEIYAGPPAEDFSGVSLQFKVADVNAFKSSLPADVAVTGPTRRPWGSTYLYLTDPNGIDVIVFEGGF